MKEIKGDLIQLAIDGEFDVIIHGCNCFNTMWKGIAKQIKETFPEAYNIDCTTKKGDKSKLGTYSGSIIERNSNYFAVINAYTQYKYNQKIGNKDLVSYKAIKSIFAKIKQNFSSERIGYPKIGAGLAGGDWKIISEIINEELQGEDHTLVIYNVK